MLERASNTAGDSNIMYTILPVTSDILKNFYRVLYIV